MLLKRDKMKPSCRDFIKKNELFGTVCVRMQRRCELLAAPLLDSILVVVYHMRHVCSGTDNTKNYYINVSGMEVLKDEATKRAWEIVLLTIM